MRRAASEFPDEPTVDGAKGQSTLPCEGAGAFDVFEQPRNFGGGKIGVDNETGFAADGGRVTGGLEAVTILSGAAVLPHDGVMDGFAGLAIPEEGGLALIGDADGGDLFGGELGLFQRSFGGGELGFPNRLGIMFHPAGLWEDLRKLLLCHGLHTSGVIENNRA